MAGRPAEADQVSDRELSARHNAGIRCSVDEVPGVLAEPVGTEVQIRRAGLLVRRNKSAGD